MSRRYHHLEHDQSLLEATDVLPPPVAADLNGDGRMEVITTTHDAKLQVLQTYWALVLIVHHNYFLANIQNQLRWGPPAQELHTCNLLKGFKTI